MKEYEREENITIINRQIWKVTYNKARKKKVIPRYKFFKTKNYIYHINLMIQMSTVWNKKNVFVQILSNFEYEERSIFFFFSTKRKEIIAGKELQIYYE